MEILYRTSRDGGPDHEPAWRATCSCATPSVWVECAAAATSKRQAKERSAQMVLGHLRHAAGLSTAAAVAQARGGQDAAAGGEAPGSAGGGGRDGRSGQVAGSHGEVAGKLRAALQAAQDAVERGEGSPSGAAGGSHDSQPTRAAPGGGKSEAVAARKSSGGWVTSDDLLEDDEAHSFASSSSGAAPPGGGDVEQLASSQSTEVLKAPQARRKQYEAMIAKASRMGAYLEPILRLQHRRAWAAAGVLPYHVVLDDDGEIKDVLLLLGRQGQTKKLASKLGDGHALLILGGKRESRDLGPRHTAAREVAEETGRLLFGGRNRRVRGPVLWFPAGKYALFLHQMPGTRDLPTRFVERVASNESDGEISALEWVSLGEIVQRPWEKQVSWFLMKVIMTGLVERFFADGQFKEYTRGASGAAATSQVVVRRQGMPSRRLRRALRSRASAGGQKGGTTED